MVNSIRPFLALQCAMLSGMLSAQDLSWYHAWEYEYINNLPEEWLGAGHLAVDPSGNTFMVSQLKGTIDVDPGPGIEELNSADGQAWINLWPTSVCVGKFDPNGVRLWTKHFGYSPMTFPLATDVDAFGNVYITGGFGSTADFDPGPGAHMMTAFCNVDGFVVKLDPDGELLWAYQFGGLEDDHGWNLDVDANGNVFVLLSAFGTFDVDPGPGVVYFTPNNQLSSILKLDTDGNLVWARTCGSAMDVVQFDEVAADANGNVVMVGRFNGTAADLDPGPGTAYLPPTAGSTWGDCVVKWDANGDYDWAIGIDGNANSVVCDLSGNIFVAGQFTDTIDLNPGPGLVMRITEAFTAPWIVKFDGTGSYLWGKAWTAEYIAHAQDICVDTEGNVLATGHFREDLDLAPGPVQVPVTADLGENSWLTALAAANGDYLLGAQWGDGEHLAFMHQIAAGPDNSVRVSGWFYGAMDMDPGSGTTLYTGPTNYQSTALIMIQGAGISMGHQTETSRTAPTLYPIPTAEVLRVSGAVGIERYTLLDAAGKIMLERPVVAQDFTLDLSQLPAGCYLLRMQGEDQVMSRSLVKH